MPGYRVLDAGYEGKTGYDEISRRVLDLKYESITGYEGIRSGIRGY